MTGSTAADPSVQQHDVIDGLTSAGLLDYYCYIKTCGEKTLGVPREAFDGLWHLLTSSGALSGILVVHLRNEKNV